MKKIKKSSPLAFNDKDASNFVSEIFGLIKSSRTIENINLIIDRHKYGDHIKNEFPPEERYPRLRLRITPDEINSLKDIGALTEKMQFSKNIAVGELFEERKLTALEKLLYSILWKNGDLGKEHHLISGVLGKGLPAKFGSVFHEFGGYLAGHHSYIIDQHTLRCFGVYSSSEEDICTARKLEIINRSNKKHIEWMKLYKAFYEDISLNIDCDKNDFLYVVDRLLFSVGKLIKLKK